VFDVDELIAECRDAIRESEPRLAVRDVLQRALDRPGEVSDVLARSVGGLELLHHPPELTILNFVWAPEMVLYPHDHRMWAAIGIYGGTEDNVLYRRTAEGIVPSGDKELHDGDVLVLGSDAVHAVRNPTKRFTGAIHVYGGDFVNEPRSQWDPESMVEEPFDLEQVKRVFADANEMWAAADGRRC
jgi:predicted metal-dependent enzyme (double-stranded beta helix superfamily)